MLRKRASLIWLWTTAALAGLTWGPTNLFSYHIEHFLAFYIISILAAAGLPRVRLHQITLALMLMALILATVRLVIPQHRFADAEDLAADIAGIAAAIGPIIVGRIRHIAALATPR
jgi:Na+/H+-dicarboxylate symporter